MRSCIISLFVFSLLGWGVQSIYKKCSAPSDNASVQAYKDACAKKDWDEAGRLSPLKLSGIYLNANYPVYFKELEEARKKYEGRITIRGGLEFGMQPHLADRFRDIAQSCHLDYIVASQHLVDSMDPYYPEAWEGFTPDELISRYYQEMLSNIKAMKEWDSLAHMDYIIRYIPNQNGHVYDSYERHSDVIDEILRYVISSGKCLEVNTAGYKYGLGQPNPSPAILKRYRQLGGERITVGADAHAPEHIAGGFIQAEKLLLSLGFRTYSVFKQRRMREIQFSSISS